MKRVIGILGVMLAAFLLCASPVYADMPNPDSDPTIVGDSLGIDVYQNVLETGDLFMLVYMNIPYAVPPDDPVSSTFSVSFRSADGLTLFGATSGFAYNVGTYTGNGYGYNVYSIYLTAAEVTAHGIAWGNAYKLRLNGSPAFFLAPPVYNYDVDPGDYNASGAETVKGVIAARIIEIATNMNTRWGLTAVYYLTEENEAVTNLSIYGEALFRGAIRGVQAIAPDVFAVAINAIDYTERTWTTNYTDAVSSQYDGTWIQTSRTAGAALFGASYDLLTVILMVCMGAGLIVANIMLSSDFWNALIDVSVLMVFAARLDFYDFFFLLLIGAIASIYIARTIWFRVFQG